MNVTIVAIIQLVGYYLHPYTKLINLRQQMTLSPTAIFTPVQNYLGISLIVVAVALPLIWYVELGSQFRLEAVFSQYVGAVALICMAIGQFLATRFRWLEYLFGGMDRIYVIHKWLAICTIACLLLHENIDPEVRGGFKTIFSGIAGDVGEVGYYGILILSIVTALTFIPYHMWKWTHKLMGLFFTLGVFHFTFEAKAFHTFDPLGIYVLLFCIVGVLSYLYILLFRSRISELQYKVAEINHLDQIAEVTLHPLGRKLKATPGQFAFLQFKQERLKEVHPFTLSDSVGENGSIRFSIKSLGSYTSRLKESLELGATVSVSGPFGRFNPNVTSHPTIWIAGGIGITPFLASIKDPNFTKSGKTKLYYCVRTTGDVPYTTELQQAAELHENFDVIILNSHMGDRLTAERIIAESEVSISATMVYYCGPRKFRIDLWEGLRAAGLKRRNFKFENFEIRTGIGIVAFAQWCYRKIRNRYFGQNLTVQKNA